MAAAYTAEGHRDRIFRRLPDPRFYTLLLVIALGVYLTTPGPLFFRPVRLLDGQPFHLEVPFAVPHAGTTASRFGVFLRHTGLEGLPQLLNVLDGSMAIVGPCPARRRHNAQVQGGSTAT